MSEMSSTELKKRYSPTRTLESFFTQKQVQISNCGQYIFCQCLDAVTIIQLSSGVVVHKIDFGEEQVTSISLSSNNHTLAVGFNSSSIKYYDVKDIFSSKPQLLTTFRSYHRGPVLTLCWDSSSTLLASASSDGTVRIWDLKQKFCTHSLKDVLGVSRVLMFDEDLRVRPWIFGAIEECIYIWMLEAGSSKAVGKLEGHNSMVTGLQLSNTREQLISCGLDKVIILWDLEEMVSKRIIPVFESLSGLILKPSQMDWCGLQTKSNENVVFTIGNSAQPRIWNVDLGKELWKSSEPIVPEAEKEVLLFTSILFNTSLKSFVLTTYDHSIIFVESKSMLVEKQLVGHNDEILDVIFLGQSMQFTVVASNSCQLRIYDNSSQSCQLVNGHSATVISLANHPIEKSIFGSCSHDNTSRVWRLMDSGSAQCLAIATGHTHSVGCIVFAKDFIVTGSRDTCIKKWEFDMHQKHANLRDLKLSSLRTQKAHEKDINSLAISKDFKFLATGSLDHTAKLWDAKSVEHLGTFQGHKKGIWCVQFSPTDCILATSSADATIKLWSLTDFSNVATFEGHEVGILKIAFVSKGLQLISGGSDGLMKLWSLKDNLCVDTFDEHDDKLWAISTADDGRMIVTGGADSKIIWWNDVTEEESKKDQHQKEKIAEEEQLLMNLLHKKKWSKALRLSLRLQQPFRGLLIMKQLLDDCPSELDTVLKHLKKDELATLMEFAVQWNTKTKNLREAQSVIKFILQEHLPEELEGISQWQTIIEGLLPYTDRHLKRVSVLHQSASIINFMNSCISLEVSEFDVDETVGDDILSAIPRVKIEETVVLDDSGMEVSSEKSNDDSCSSKEGLFGETDLDVSEMVISHSEVLPEELKSYFVIENTEASSEDAN